MIVPVLSYNSRTGSASAPLNPVDGPIARIMSRFAEGPRMMNPPMRTLSPVPTCMRVESWTSRPGSGDDGDGEVLRNGCAVEVRGGYGEDSAADLMARDEDFGAAHSRVRDRGIITRHGKGQRRNLGNLGDRDEIRAPGSD